MTEHSPQSPLVQIKGLCKTFGTGEGRVVALDDVSFEISQGEHLAVIGPSGSGKSTLLHMLAGLDTPDAGGVIVSDQDLAQMGDRKLTLFRRRHIGMIFQAYNLVSTMTAEDNLCIPLLLARTNDRDKVDAMLQTLGLRDRRRHRPDELSGGEQQRLAIGRAMIANPDVILADEPTGNLDSATGRNVCELLHRLCGEFKRTIVTVTHDPAVAMWASRVLVLCDGRIVESLDTASFASAAELGARFLEIIERHGKSAPCA